MKQFGITAVQSALIGLFLQIVALPVQALEIRGEWLQGSMLIGRVAPGESVEFNGRMSRVDKDGWFVIGLGRDEPHNAVVKVHAGDQQKPYEYTVAPRQYQEQPVTGVPQETVTPPDSVLKRIAEEALLVKQARSIDSSPYYFLQGFKKPLQGPITGVYGSRRVYNGTPKNPHYGLDIAAPEGALVYAPAPGTVRLVHADMYFSGGTLIIDHGGGIFSTYIHLSDILVKEGEDVDYSTPVAKVGSTGRATGPHLDWRINWFDTRVDPALVLKNFPAR